MLKVETFEVTEVMEDGKVAEVECSNEVKKLIDSMDLKGQKNFIQDTKDKEGVQVVPYRKMTSDEEFVYKQLCPEFCDFEEYSESIMPVRVLQIAAHCYETKFFDEGLVVWHRTNADIKDPVLVGQRKKGYKTEQFILARWGEELEEFSILKDKAISVWREATKSLLRKAEQQIKSSLAMIDTANPLAIKNLYEPSFTGFDRGY